MFSGAHGGWVSGSKRGRGSLKIDAPGDQKGRVLPSPAPSTRTYLAEPRPMASGCRQILRVSLFFGIVVMYG